MKDWVLAQSLLKVGVGVVVAEAQSNSLALQTVKVLIAVENISGNFDNLRVCEMIVEGRLTTGTPPPAHPILSSALDL
jgi:hypothetical protein